ncbi:hypothetical protein Rs2_15978 [Raphanus sativus]|nr:hypothetical protein Rs2_15978 [Raphanus sativus]
MPRCTTGEWAPGSTPENCTVTQRGTGCSPCFHFQSRRNSSEKFPFVGYPHEQTVSRKVTMPHFQRMAMEQRMLRGCATFQLAPDDDLPRKRGRPSKAARVTWEPPIAFAGECQCGAPFQNKQKVRSVAGYTEDFINQAKLCKPKSAEMWCSWYKHGLRKDIQAQLKGVLEPLEFALEPSKPGRKDVSESRNRNHGVVSSQIVISFPFMEILQPPPKGHHKRKHDDDGLSLSSSEAKRLRNSSKVTDFSQPSAVGNMLEALDGGKFGGVTKEWKKWLTGGWGL